MAIIRTQQPDFWDNLLKQMVQSQELQLRREALDQRKEALKQRQNEFQFEQEQAEMQRQQMASPFLQLMQQVGAGDPTAQQQLAQSPQAQIATQAAGDATNRGFATRSAVAGMEQAQRGRLDARKRAVAAVQNMELPDEVRENLTGRMDVMFNLIDAGIDPSLVKEGLPPDQAALLDLQEARYGLRSTDDARTADGFATNWFVRQGIFPEGTPLVPGASDTLNKIVEAREKEGMDWLQEGLDFITGRVGDSISGSPFAVGPNGQISLAMGGEAVSVEEAVNEWKEIVSRYAPEPIAERVIEQIDSNQFQRNLRRDVAALEVEGILRAAEDQAAAVSQVRDLLAEDFTTAEIDKIIRDARARFARERR